MGLDAEAARDQSVDLTDTALDIEGAINNTARTHDSIIDDFRIYGQALSEEEISDLANLDPGLAPVIENVFPEPVMPSTTQL